MKEEVELNRPSYIGQSVLDISKLQMYQLQYRQLQDYREHFDCEIEIVAGDTDSFFLKTRNVDWNVLLSAMKNDGMLDTSNYPPTHPLYLTALDSVLGLFKDEAKGVRIMECVFLRPKCYAMLLESMMEILKSKGVGLHGSGINYESYLMAYLSGDRVKIPQVKFTTTNHQIFTTTSEKMALHCFDDKRYWTSQNKSLPYGHYSIRDADSIDLSQVD